MLRRLWRDRLDLIADKGLEFLNLRAPRERPVAELLRRLLAQRGEASALALARELVERIGRMTPEQQGAFLELLASDYAADPALVTQAIERWRELPEEASLEAVVLAAEAPRVEIVRRLNNAPGGTAAIVRLRARLLEILPARPHLRALDNDLRRLLAVWFNRGFLTLETISWSTPAVLLEKLIAYEAVHRIHGWDDLRGRLAPDRRCFAFFHPALPDEPLIFVEVALVEGLSAAIGPLIAPSRPVADPARADTAIFYSINNCQDGLRGISFGNFLIKQVVAELKDEFPGLANFSTLSPIPGLAGAVGQALGDKPPFGAARLEALLGESAEALCKAAGLDDPVEALIALGAAPDTNEAVLDRPLRRVVLAYLALARRRGQAFDPVAHFHLSNGARIERINLAADLSDNGRAQSFGAMVNYLYDLKSLEANHERYAGGEAPAMAKPLAQAAQRLRPLWQEAEARAVA